MSANLRILFLSRWFPYPPDNGARIRIFNLIKQLSKRHQVTLISFSDREEDQAAVPELNRYCNGTITVRYQSFRPRSGKGLVGLLSSRPRYLVDTHSKEMAAIVDARTKSQACDLVLASGLDTISYAPGQRYVPSILEELQILQFRDAFVEATNISRKFRYWLMWSKLRLYLSSCLPQFAACTVASSYERDALERSVSRPCRTEVIANGVDLDHYHYGEQARIPNTLIYPGSLTYQANYDAMRYFLSEVYPLVRSGCPQVRLQITGQTEGVDLAGLNLSPEISLTGHLPDVRKAVAGSSICVVPLRLGGGTRLKILEAMALGTPVVSTAKGAEGLDVCHDENILIADDPASFARSIVELLANQSARERLSVQARCLVEDKYSWDTIGAKLVDLVDDVARTLGSLPARRDTNLVRS